MLEYYIVFASKEKKQTKFSGQKKGTKGLHLITVITPSSQAKSVFLSVFLALWSTAGKGMTSWLSFVMSNCDIVTFPLVSWVRCGA